MNDLIELERQKWDAFRRRDAELLGRIYDPDAISIGYGGDGSVGVRRTAEFLRGLGELELEEVALDGFEVLPVGDTGAVITYRASFDTARGLHTTVLATSVWRRDGTGWKTVLFQATSAPAEPPADERLGPGA